jgi:AraC-like DNA-binding protein
MDKLSVLIGRNAVGARIFHNGEFCGATDFSDNAHIGQLHLVRRGPVIFNHPDSPSIQVLNPALILYPRGMRHTLVVPPDKSASLLCASIAFHGGSDNLLAKALPDCLHVAMADMDASLETIEILFREADNAGFGQDLILDRLCDVLLIQMIRHEVQAGRISLGLLSGLTDQKLSRVLAAINENPQKQWRLESLADMSGMSRSTFARHFQTVVGTTPGQYITERRIRMAQELLTKGQPIKRVSLDVGYGSQPAFARAFKEKTGASPKSWLSLVARKHACIMKP